jgi:mycothiol synthase
MVGSDEIPTATGPHVCDDLAMSHVVLRAPVDGDVEAMSRVVDAQDVAWWGAPDGDVDDLRDELERVRAAAGSLGDGARVAVVDGAIVGVALLVGHGHTSVAVDASEVDGALIRRALLEWITSLGDVEVEAPSQDVDRRHDLEAFGLAPTRSSFELERPGDGSDLPAMRWPEGVASAPFRPGVDDEELHRMIYSFWTDVPGHTDRPLDEWRSLFVQGSWFDPELVVIARSDEGAGPIVGCALGRTFTGDVGWISQLGVARTARGLGLGRTVLVEACRRLSALDPRIIGLGVEAENANALGLYRSVGFEVVREWVHYARR